MLLDKQLDLIPVRTVYLVKLVQAEQIWNAKIVKLDIIKTKKVFLHVLDVFQVNIRMKLEKQTAQNVALVSTVHVLIQI